MPDFAQDTMNKLALPKIPKQNKTNSTITTKSHTLASIKSVCVYTDTRGRTWWRLGSRTRAGPCISARKLWHLVVRSSRSVFSSATGEAWGWETFKESWGSEAGTAGWRCIAVVPRDALRCLFPPCVPGDLVAQLLVGIKGLCFLDKLLCHR